MQAPISWAAARQQYVDEATTDGCIGSGTLVSTATETAKRCHEAIILKYQERASSTGNAGSPQQWQRLGVHSVFQAVQVARGSRVRVQKRPIGSDHHVSMSAPACTWVRA
jgi:hypothetical protein